MSETIEQIKNHFEHIRLESENGEAYTTAFYFFNEKTKKTGLLFATLSSNNDEISFNVINKNNSKINEASFKAEKLHTFNAKVSVYISYEIQSFKPENLKTEVDLGGFEKGKKYFTFGFGYSSTSTFHYNILDATQENFQVSNIKDCFPIFDTKGCFCGWITNPHRCDVVSLDEIFSINNINLRELLVNERKKLIKKFTNDYLLELENNQYLSIVKLLAFFHNFKEENNSNDKVFDKQIEFLKERTQIGILKSYIKNGFDDFLNDLKEVIDEYPKNHKDLLKIISAIDDIIVDENPIDDLTFAKSYVLGDLLPKIFHTPNYATDIGMEIFEPETIFRKIRDGKHMNPYELAYSIALFDTDKKGDKKMQEFEHIEKAQNTIKEKNDDSKLPIYHLEEKTLSKTELTRYLLLSFLYIVLKRNRNNENPKHYNLFKYQN